MKFAAFKSRFANWREREMNPILVKELRQAVRSHILEGMLMLLLLMLFFGSVATLTGESLRSGIEETGRAMFRSCLVMLAIGGLLFIPIYTGIRLALEKYQSDMMFFTPMKPHRLVQGKVLGGVCLAGLFFCVCLPFMAFTSLLRGVDFFTIAFTVLLLFVAIYQAIVASVAIGSASAPVVGKLILGAVFVGGLLLFCWLMLAFLFEIVQFGIEPLIRNGEFAYRVYAFFITMVVGLMVSYGFSISSIVKDTRRENFPVNQSIPIPSHD